MKNPNQAKVKTAKSTSVAPAQKLGRSLFETITPRRHAPLIVLARDPLRHHAAFELELDWIGDTMAPEVFQGNLVEVMRRENMTVCVNELVLGLLRDGRLVFGAYSTHDRRGLVRIAFINPAYPSVYYQESDFEWLYPVARVSALNEDRTWRRITKTIEFEAGDDRLELELPAAA